MVRDLLADDFVDHTPFPGFEGTKQRVLDLFVMLRTAFPDLRAEMLHQIAEGEMVAPRKVFHGTHAGRFFGMPGSGKKVTITVIHLVRVSGGKMREYWNLVDQAGLMAQLR